MAYSYQHQYPFNQYSFNQYTPNPLARAYDTIVALGDKNAENSQALAIKNSWYTLDEVVKSFKDAEVVRLKYLIDADLASRGLTPQDIEYLSVQNAWQTVGDARKEPQKMKGAMRNNAYGAWEFLKYRLGGGGGMNGYGYGGNGGYAGGNGYGYGNGNGYGYGYWNGNGYGNGANMGYGYGNGANMGYGNRYGY
ncbi:hypothetical protein B0J11DRAFT_581244 [Dendryphion nanum]|uniref:Uncharacterized protein n=1 Tax=Dendryphion nanum TaxID=256645 RepID=A0A9P9DP82_9PLEO|nr:hypothetical protein B0J11DRAFT_581244 [Dendryphion nanum]